MGPGDEDQTPAAVLVLRAERRVETEGLTCEERAGARVIPLDARGLRVGRLGGRAPRPGDAPWLRAFDSSLSRLHFTVFAARGAWYVRDERSTGGTFLNEGERLTALAGPRPLRDGDVIWLGAPRGGSLVFRSPPPQTP